MSGDPMEGKRHCDQCFRFFPNTDRHFTCTEWNFPLADGTRVNLDEIFCSLNCLELWKRGVEPAVAHQTAVK